MSEQPVYCRYCGERIEERLKLSAAGHDEFRWVHVDRDSQLCYTRQHGPALAWPSY